MEKNKPPNQSSLYQFFAKKDPPKPKNPNLMEIENDVIELLFEIRLPHQYPDWKHVSLDLRDIADGKILKFDQFFKVMRRLVSLSVRDPDLSNLETFFTLLEENRRKDFFGKVLPFMGSLALKAETLFKSPLKRLPVGQCSSVVLSKLEVACLLSHMFFCTIYKPRRTKSYLLNKNWNMSSLFATTTRQTRVSSNLEKLKCIYHYFERIQTEMMVDLKVIFARAVRKPAKLENWLGSERKMRAVEIRKEMIEDYVKNSIQLDFANMYLGGGVLSSGCVQEEIRFCINPELLVSMPIFDCLEDDEAAVIIGTEQFSRYKGYGDTFKYDGDCADPSEIIETKEGLARDIAILAIDARKYQDQRRQYTVKEILREINKAFVGFEGSGWYPEKKEEKRKLATGNWGCGAFKGDPELKLILQWIAASQCERDMNYSQWGDKRLEGAECVILNLKEKSVGKVLKDVLKACELISSEKEKGCFFEVLNGLL